MFLLKTLTRQFLSLGTYDRLQYGNEYPGEQISGVQTTPLDLYTLLV